MVPDVVLTQSKPVHITAVRPVTTVVPKIKVTRPRHVKPIITKTKSPTKRHTNRSPSPKATNSPLRVTAVKALKGNPQHALKDKGVIDSGCSRHMTGNMSYLFDFKELNGGDVAFGGNPKGGKISGKVSYKCVTRKNSVLFTDTEFLILSPDFKLPNESQVLHRVPRENNMYNLNLKNIVPFGDLTFIFAKATIDESNLWHRRLGHINFKTMNKLVKGNLVIGLPTKAFENDNTCVAWKKGKQHRASCKTKTVSFVNQPLYRLHMDLFRPTFVKSLNKKSYCLVVTDDYSRFTWLFFLATKDETSPILKTFITSLENQLSLKVKVIKSDNGTEFKNNDLNQFCGMKGNKREFSNGPTWLFDIDSLTKTMNYQQVTTGNQTNPSAGFQDEVDAEKEGEESDQQYVLFPVWSSGSTNPHNTDGDAAFDGKEPEFDAKKHDSSIGQISPNSTNTFSVAGPLNAAARPTHGKSSFIDASQLLDDPDMLELENITYSDDKDDVGTEDDFNNLETSITVSPIPTTRVHKDHPMTLIIGDLSPNTQTRSMSRVAKDQGGLSQMFNDDFHTCMFPCFLSQEEPKRICHTEKELLVPNGFSGIKRIKEALWSGTKQDLSHKDTHRRRELTMKKYPVARIEAIRLFLAYASFMGFMVYQMDVKSALLYGTIKKKVYVCQPSGFEDPDHPDKVYNVVKALYGLHQAPRDWYETLANYLLENGFQRGKIDQTLFIKRQKGDILLVQIYVDDIIFGQTTTGKEISNPFMAGSLPKRVNTTRCDEDRLELKELTVFLLPKVNDLIRLQALVDKKKVVVTEATIRDALHLDDAEGVKCLPNEEIFKEVARIGYEKPSTKLTFYKAFFSSHKLEKVLMMKSMMEEFLQLVMLLKEMLVLLMMTFLLLLKNHPFYLIHHLLHHHNHLKISLLLPKHKQHHHNHLSPYCLEVDKVSQAMDITKLKQSVKKLEMGNKVKVLKLRRLQKVGTTQRVETSDETVMDDVSNQKRMIAEMDQDVDVVLKDDKEVADDVKDVLDDIEESAQDQGRKAESQAEIYKIDLEHANKVLSMQEDESEPVEVQEVVDVVTTTKIITEVVTTASETITAASATITAAEAQVPAATNAVTLTSDATRVTASPSKRRKRVVIRDPQEESTTSTIIPSETKPKDKGKGILVEEPKPLRKQAQIEQTKEQIEEEESIALKRLNETPTEKAAKRQKSDEEVEELKRHLQIVPNEDDDVYIEATPLAQKVPIVGYEIIEQNNKPYYKIIRADDTLQLYRGSTPLTKFTLDQMLNAVRLEVKEESEVSLELLRFIQQQHKEGAQLE
uniref:Putative ribonuclease H-like domain-containing protein n=1 Tax=Tanacetum cinerariifolium TaxID=118510 RepID=A0A6L2MLW7_TANCI|nr:putative ribonuclease H-like domain-containing protein [Tanacetum cinerariifolium]